MNFWEYFRSAPTSSLETKGEALICVTFRNWLVEQTYNKHCRAVWFHVQNESNQGSKTYRFWNLQRNMGKLAGVSDYVFMFKNGNLALEIKDGKKGKQTEAQCFFENWCLSEEVPYEIARTLEEAIAFTKKYQIVI